MNFPRCHWLILQSENSVSISKFSKEFSLHLIEKKSDDSFDTFSHWRITFFAEWKRLAIRIREVLKA